jgi:outer membrane protein assembly factor BamB
LIAWDGRHQGTHVPRSPITVFSIPRDLISVQQSPATSIAGLFICILNRDDGKTELVLAVPGEVWGLNSETGKLSWFVETQLTGNISPNPLVIDQSIYVFGGYRSAGSYRIRSGGKGDITKSHVDWYSSDSSYVATPIHHEGRFYWIDDKGIAWCQDASSGKQVYRERVQQLRAGGRPVYASPIVANGKLYIVTRHDGTLIIPATTEFTVESHNVLQSDHTDFNATPAVYDDQLLLRSNRALYCIKSKN